jgi:acetyltransferase
MLMLLQIARDEKIERVVAEIMPENTGMRRICEKLGFTFTRIPDSPNIRAEFSV